MRVLGFLSLLDRDGNLSLTAVVLGVGLVAGVAGLFVAPRVETQALALLLFALALLNTAHRRVVNDRAAERNRVLLADQIATANQSIEALAKGLEDVRKIAAEAQVHATQANLGTIGVPEGVPFARPRQRVG